MCQGSEIPNEECKTGAADASRSLQNSRYNYSYPGELIGWVRTGPAYSTRIIKTNIDSTQRPI